MGFSCNLHFCGGRLVGLFYLGLEIHYWGLILGSMEDVWLVKQGWVWFQSQKHGFSRVRAGIGSARARAWVAMERYWPLVCCGCKKFWEFVALVLSYSRVCYQTGFESLVGLGSAALLLIMWSCFLSLTSILCLVYLLISMGVAGATITYLGYTSGLFIVGLFAILILWMYANFLIVGLLFIIGGYLFSLKHARLMVFMATVYSLYCVKVRAGWLGVFLSINLAFLSNHALNYLLQWCDKLNERTCKEEYKPAESFTEDDFSGEYEFSTRSSDESKKTQFCKPSKATAATASVKNMKSPKENMKSPKESTKNQNAASSSQVMKEDKSSLIEMQRILASAHHYEALGFPRHKKIDGALLKKEYHKKARLVHPDKNMGCPQASESFKKLQCAYEVLSDSLKKRDYDEQLRRDESKNNTLKSSSTSNQDNRDFFTEESRRIQCTKCGHSHVWVCTNRSKAKARWCKDCCQYHQAKDGDGWVEHKGSLAFDGPQKVEIPRAFVCAESKIFDVSEWAICQEMACRPNTHRPSFRVNMVGLEKTTRSNSSRFPWDLDAEMLDEDEDFELWLQQALASGLFSDTSARRKTWSPFKLNQKKKQYRRSSSGFT